MASSYRKCFIRVSSINNTNTGVITYSKEDIVNKLVGWSDTANITYWMIEHTADKDVSMTHYHIVIKFGSPTMFTVIKNKFPYGDIESAKNLKATVQYLVHLNDKSKKQYSWDDICTNCDDMTPYKVQSNNGQEITLQDIIDKINIGEIREYNQFTSIPIEIWSKYKSRIENALLYYKERICMDKNREINVIFMSGDTGTGKTTFAKMYCQKTNKTYCISSSSNDVMQDYKGEDVLILDDMRDNSILFPDMLKMLDNHTKSSVASRYHNKAFIGDLIIITSAKPLSDWYYSDTSENKHQLYRRIRLQYQFTSDSIDAYEYNDKKAKYEFVGRTFNVVTQMQKDNGRKSLSLFAEMGLELTKEEPKQEFVQIKIGDDVPIWK